MKVMRKIIEIDEERCNGCGNCVIACAEGAVEIVFRKEMEQAEDKAARRSELIERYRQTFASPYVAAGRRLVDDIIEPANTRRHLAQALEYLQNKRIERPSKKHGLIPL